MVPHHHQHGAIEPARSPQRAQEPHGRVVRCRDHVEVIVRDVGYEREREVTARELEKLE